jgi:hypothetical protein
LKQSSVGLAASPKSRRVDKLTSARQRDSQIFVLLPSFTLSATLWSIIIEITKSKR